MENNINVICISGIDSSEPLLDQVDHFAVIGLEGFILFEVLAFYRLTAFQCVRWRVEVQLQREVSGTVLNRWEQFDNVQVEGLGQKHVEQVVEFA